MSTMIIQAITEEVVCKMLTIFTNEIVLILFLVVDEPFNILPSFISMPNNRPSLKSKAIIIFAIIGLEFYAGALNSACYDIADLSESITTVNGFI